MEKFGFENSKVKPNRRIERNSESTKMNRRNFLTVGALALASSVLEKRFGILKNFLENKDNPTASSGEIGVSANEASRMKPMLNISERATEKQAEIKEEDQLVIRKTIKEQLEESDEVVLDISTKKALQKKWKESYAKKPENCPEEDRETGKNHLGLLRALEKMQPWIDLMKNEFVKIGVPEEFAFLTIPESHFELNAYSWAKAKGPYQFTKGTAKRFKLKIGENIDERCDPIESARACAEHLKYSYKRFNNDWDLAFADYNGGYTNKYENFREKTKDRSYTDYLKWREKRINDFIKEHKGTSYEVQSGDGLLVISKKYGVSVDKIKELNGLKNDNIKIGQKLIISEEFDVHQLDQSMENLNYPEKFYAVLDVIKEENLEKRFPAKDLKFELVEVEKDDFVEFNRKVKSGDTVSRIARGLKIKNGLKWSVDLVLKQLISQNHLGKKARIKPGQNLKLRISNARNSSLLGMAKKNGIQLSKLKKLNPAVVNSKEPLPSGYEIRVPRA